MLKRVGGYLEHRSGDDAPAASRQLEALGYALLEGVLDSAEVAALRQDLERLYEEYPPDGRSTTRESEEDNDFRYESFNRSPIAQRIVAHPGILAVLEPLLGEDCHIIANTCWRNPPRDSVSHGGGGWHIDAGPHVPRAPGISWDERIPYPIFAIGVHIFVADCPLASGPTGVLPGSHKSGQHPPADAYNREDLTYEGQPAVALVAKAGDVAFFVSDVWHRRLPATAGDQGRFFLQAHYGRRDIAQRIRPTDSVNHLAPEARARITTKREKQLLGLHRPMFYDG